MSLSDRLARGVKATFVAQVVRFLANGLLILLLTRYLLTPAGYGLLYFAVSVLGVVGLLGRLGLPKSTARYVTEYSQTDPGQVPHLLRRSTLVLGALIAAVGVLLVLTSGPLAALLGEPALVPFLVLGVLYLAGRSLTTFCLLVFQGFNRVDLSAILEIINGVGRVVFATALVLAGLGALGALLGYAVGFVLAAVVGLAVLYWQFVRPIDTADSVDPALTARLAKYSVPTAATGASVVVDSKVDKILVGALLNTTAVGYYTLAAQIADFCTVPAKSLGFTISPALGEQRADDRTDRAARIYETSLEHVLALYVPAAVGLVLVAEPTVMTIFGQGYAGAIPALEVFGVFILVRAIGMTSADGLDYLGLARIRAIARGGSAIANLGLNLALIPVLGVVGAAAATVVTYSAYTAVNVYYIHLELGLDVTRLLATTARVGAVSAVMGVAVFVVLPHVSTLPTLLATVAMGAAIWVTLSVATGVVDVARVRSLIL